MALRLAVIPGDGIGPEVVDQALRVLDAAASKHGLETSSQHFPFSAGHYLDTGHVLESADLDELRKFDAILLGAVGGQPNDPRLAGGVIEKGILLKLRFELDQYINLRPVKLYPGIETPIKGKGEDDIDFVVVRENTEDLYCGLGGVLREGTPNEVANQTMVASRFGVERCVRYAFEAAVSRKAAGYPGKLTLVHKTNVLNFAGATWLRVFKELAEEFPGVETGYQHVDACCMFMVTRPEDYDVIVVPNMFGDIITDLGAAIAGGMGIAASGNLDPTGSAPSMYEPVHGSAPDIAGQDKANPIATIDTMALLLRETGRIKGDEAMVSAGDAVAAAVQAVTPEFAGKSLDRSGYGCAEVGSMVIDALG
ncbi:MAG: 3-isopropylmalate dehydrogenase [Planctomycetota bacterium]